MNYLELCFLIFKHEFWGEGRYLFATNYIIVRKYSQCVIYTSKFVIRFALEKRIEDGSMRGKTEASS